MKRKIMKKWVEALLSGEYKQGKGYLRESRSKKKATYCCLGVLCDLAVKDGVISKDVVPRNKNQKVAVFGEEAYHLPAKVREWAGIKNALGDIKGMGVSLADLNDEGLSFKCISNIISHNYKKL